MNVIQLKIRKYLQAANTSKDKEKMMMCFVGMIETGEATSEDFVRAGGIRLRDKVWRKQGQIEQERMRREFEQNGCLS